MITNILVSKVTLPFVFLLLFTKEGNLSFYGRLGWTNHSKIKITALKQKNKKHVHTGKRARNALSRERTLELRQ
jgi:hypothetical protein